MAVYSRNMQWEREEDNKRVALWTEVQCVNEEYINATGILNAISSTFVDKFIAMNIQIIRSKQ
jgi:hypothetical protein